MSILIKGMEMPKRHLFEGLVAIGDGQIVVKDLENNKLFEGEIKEIPTPHGRLIDADEIEKCVHEWYDVGEYVFADTIRDADTIIEAEVSGE